MLTEKPYPIRAMIVMGSNPLSSQADTRKVYRALKSLDLLVVLELVNTPTTMLADYVLPIAGALESPVLQTNAGISNIAYGGEAAIPPMYERHYDFDFWRGLAIRLGQEADWRGKHSTRAWTPPLNPWVSIGQNSAKAAYITVHRLIESMHKIIHRLE
jgi:anaerobic selenocysteine-containing dehydrogenase